MECENAKRAFIFGISGQDGSYLSELLLSKGYEVWGMVRRSSTFEGWWRLDKVKDQVHLIYGDITDPFSIIRALKESNPTEIYNLCAQSHVQVSWEIPYMTALTTGIGVLNILESVKALDLEKKVKIYQASTSEMFSGKDKGLMNEETRFDPQSPYGTAKQYAYQICKNYRDAFGMFISNGILFNHESSRRGDNFVTKKIINQAKTGKLHLGNTDAMRDWGLAKEYCEAMWLMLQQDKPDDFVIATGETHSVKEFVEWVEEWLGTKLQIVIDKNYIRPQDVNRLCGDASKAKRVLGWEAKTKGKDLVKFMYEND